MGMCQTCSILYRIYWGRGVEGVGGGSGGSLTGEGGSRGQWDRGVEGRMGGVEGRMGGGSGGGA